MLSGCTLPSWLNNVSTTTNDADTGKFDKVVVTYNDNHTKTFNRVEVYPYNNGGEDSTGGRVEIRQGKHVTVLPNDAQVELFK